MADFIPLARAAALAHERLFPEQPSKDYKTLDVIALALSALMPLYQRDMESGALRALAEGEITAGNFTATEAHGVVPHPQPLHVLVGLRALPPGAVRLVLLVSVVVLGRRPTPR